MGKSKIKSVNKEQEAKTEKLNKPIVRNQSMAMRRYGGNFRNFNNSSRRSENYWNYGNYYGRDYGSSYSWAKGNHSSNIRPYTRKLATKPYKKKPPSRPISPVLGSEEYMVRKIQQTSAIIMKQLLNPDEQIINNDSQTLENNKGESSKSTYEQNTKICEKPVETLSNKNKGKKINNYNIEEIQKKIVNHITNLNDGRKKNLINSQNISVYDAAIQQIQKQKRLEISRALRHMCSKSNETQESNDFINSIIPDMGIKIEDLPRDLIEELRNTLIFDLDCGTFEDTGYYPVGETQKEDLNTNDCSMNEATFSEAVPEIRIKPEPVDENEPYLFTEVSKHYNEIKENDGHKSSDTNINDSIKNRQVEQGVESENVFNTYNSSTNETVYDAVSVKLEPPDDIEHCNEIKASDANASDNIGNRQVGQEVESENVFNARSLTNDIVSHFVSVKLEPIDEPPLDDRLNCNVNKDEEDQKSPDANYSEGIEIRPVTIKQELNSEISHVQTSQPEVSVNLDSEKNDPCDYNLLFTAGKNDQFEMCSDNTEGNQNDDNGRFNNAISVNNNFSTLRSTLQKANMATQTKEEETAEEYIESFLAKYFNQPPESISEAISRMLKIDQCILKLTTYRQSLFYNFDKLGISGNKQNKNKKTNNSKNTNTTPNISSRKRKANQQKNKVKKKKNSEVIEKNKQEINCRSSDGVQMENERVASLRCENIPDKTRQQNDVQKKNGQAESLKCKNIPDTSQQSGVQNENERGETLELGNIADMTRQPSLLKFEEVHEKMLVLKLIDDKLVAAAESGKIFFCSLKDGHYIKVMEVTNVPITSLLFIKAHPDYIQMFVGSLELNLMQFTIYKFQSYCAEKNVKIDESVQCMESKWDYLFIGGMRGSLLRYSLKNKRMEDEEKFTNNSILVLKATQEGARRILIVGSRNSAICIRDAMTGLHLRVLDTTSVSGSLTVYSLILEKNLVYSGTTNHDILVFCFHDGKLMHRLKATDAKGISCMKIVKNLLFASCHNGSIYVYNLQYNTFVGSIEGPGGVILSMEVLKDQVIVGTMCLKFTSVPIPHDILRHKLKSF